MSTNGAVAVAGDLSTFMQASFGSTLSVVGSVSGYSQLSLGDVAMFGSSLTQRQFGRLGGYLQIAHNPSVSGTASITGDANLAGAFTLTGAGCFYDAVTIRGLTCL